MRPSLDSTPVLSSGGAAAEPLVRDGAALLRAFLRQHSLSQRELAKALDVSDPSVHDWIARKKVPRYLYRVAIQKWSGGAVPADAWPADDELALLDRIRPIVAGIASDVLPPSHGLQTEAPEAAAAVAPEQSSPSSTPVQAPKPTRQLNPLRRTWHGKASRIVGMAAVVVGVSRVAEKLGVHRSRVEHYCDPDSDAAMTLRDILAVGGEFARTALMSSLAALDAVQPRLNLPLDRHALRLQSAVGELSQTLERAEADGQVTADEVSEIVEKLHKTIERAEQFERDLRAKHG